MSDTLWTYGDLGKYLQLSPKTIRNWVYQGKIPHLKVNGSVRFNKSQIDLWLAERNVGEVK